MPPVPKPITTARLRLRPISVEDAEAVHAYHRLPEVARFQFWSERSRDEVVEKLKEWAAQMQAEDPDAYTFAVLRKDSGELIGDCCLQMRDRDARQAEIGYSFNPDHHGQGFAREAVAELLRFGFESVGLHRIYARCDARNMGSWKLAEALGMRREAHFREHALFKGGWDEEFYYAMLEDEWHNRQVGRG